MFLLLGRDSVALDSLLYGLVVRPKSKTALLNVGNRLVPLLGKGGGEEPGMPMKLSTGTPSVSLAWKAAYCLSCMANSLS